MLSYVVKDNMAIFYFPAPCKYCKSIQEIEMIMSKSAFNTVKCICMKCKGSWEFDK